MDGLATGPSVMAPTLGPSNICVPAAYWETLNDTVLKEDMGLGQERDGLTYVALTTMIIITKGTAC